MKTLTVYQCLPTTESDVVYVINANLCFKTPTTSIIIFNARNGTILCLDLFLIIYLNNPLKMCNNI